MDRSEAVFVVILNRQVVIQGWDAAGRWATQEKPMFYWPFLYRVRSANKTFTARADYRTDFWQPFFLIEFLRIEILI